MRQINRRRRCLGRYKPRQLALTARNRLNDPLIRHTFLGDYSAKRFQWIVYCSQHEWLMPNSEYRYRTLKPLPGFFPVILSVPPLLRLPGAAKGT